LLLTGSETAWHTVRKQFFATKQPERAVFSFEWINFTKMGVMKSGFGDAKNDWPDCDVAGAK
jgi:hypothetical protein